MGLLSWLTGRNPKQEAINAFPSDRVIVGKIATLIELHLYEEQATEGGLAQLLKPTCMAVLGKDGSVCLRWPSSPEFVRDIVSFAFLHDLPAFKGFIQGLTELSKLDNREALIKDWLLLMGPTAVDTIAAEALSEMKSKWRARRAAAGKALAPDETDWPEV
jgi:hypothetical protein